MLMFLISVYLSIRDCPSPAKGSEQYACSFGEAYVSSQVPKITYFDAVSQMVPSPGKFATFLTHT